MTANGYTAARARMLKEIVSHQQSAGLEPLDERVLAMMAELPRHEFVPPEHRLWAYDDSPLPIGQGQTISQPFIVALMTTLLDPRPEHRVLEVGTGSGYQTALLARLARWVYSLERIPLLAEQAGRRLGDLNIGNVELRAGDGYAGWPEQAPFDGIIVTAAAARLPPALPAQLKPGGRLVIPLGRAHRRQDLQLVTKDGQGGISHRSLLAVAFVPLIEGGPEDLSRDGASRALTPPPEPPDPGSAPAVP